MNTKKQKLMLENWKKFLREAEQEAKQTPELEDEDKFKSREEAEQFQQALIQGTNTDTPDNEDTDTPDQDPVRNTNTDTPDSEKDDVLHPSLSNEDVADIILAAMKKKLAKSGVKVPEDAKYLKGATSLFLTNFGSREQRRELLSKLDQKKFFDSDSPNLLKLKGTTKFKKGNRKIIITLKKGKEGTVAEKGEKAEGLAAQMINSFFAKNDLEGKDQEGRYFAEDQGGSTAVKDVVVRSKGEEPIGIEVKTTAGSRTEFGQFRIRYEKQGNWVLNELSETGKYAEAKAKINEHNRKLFGLIEQELNNIQPVPGQPAFPTGPRLNNAEAEQFWLSYLGTQRKRSLSGAVQTFEVPKEIIRERYKLKENSYILIGGDLFSLAAPGEDPHKVPSIDDKIEKVHIVFRIKSHKADELSYTCPITKVITNKLSAPLDEQLKKIFLSGQS